jgi:hypothetical protein
MNRFLAWTTDCETYRGMRRLNRMLVLQKAALVQGDVLEADRPNLQTASSDQFDVVLWRGVLLLATFLLTLRS